MFLICSELTKFSSLKASTLSNSLKKMAKKRVIKTILPKIVISTKNKMFMQFVALTQSYMIEFQSSPRIITKTALAAFYRLSKLMRRDFPLPRHWLIFLESPSTHFIGRLLSSNLTTLAYSSMPRREKMNMKIERRIVKLIICQKEFDNLENIWFKLFHLLAILNILKNLKGLKMRRILRILSGLLTKISI